MGAAAFVDARSSDVGGWISRSPTSRWLLWLVAGFLILVARRPETLLDAEFHNEDGQVFYLATFFLSPVESVFREWGGYLVVAPRLASLALQLVPPTYAPVLANAISLAVVSGIAAFLASDRLELLISHRGLRWAVAGGFILLPGSFETLGSMTNLGWYLAIGLILISVATTPRNLGAAVFDSALALVAALTGPFSVLVAPLFWIRVAERRDRFSCWLAIVVTASAIVQIAVVLLVGGRHPDPLPVLEVLGYRAIDSLLLGSLWTLLLTRVGVPDLVAGLGTVLLLMGLVTVIVTSALSREGLKVLLAALATLGASLIVLQGGYRDLLVTPYIEQRYFLIPGAYVTSAVIVGALSRGRRLRPVRLCMGLLVVVAIVGDFRLPAHKPQDWATDSACIGSATPCTIPVDPIDRWTIHWPGSAGPYIQPSR